MDAFVAILACVSVGLAASQPFTELDCPDGWQGKDLLILKGEKCYMFKVNLARDYDDARTTCILEGGQLAMPKTRALQEFMYGMLKDKYKVGGNVWIGINDKVEDGTFRFEDGTPVSDYSNWGQGRGPDSNFLTSKTSDCVVMDVKNGGQWKDMRCSSLPLSSREYPFVCEAERNQD